MKIAALTGAGISKASGVPTFIEMGDLREKLSRDYFISHPIDFYKILNEMKMTTDNAIPNDAHKVLAKYNLPIITMNIDGLHHKAGSAEDRVIEIHGSLRRVFCPKCKNWYDFSKTKQSLYCNNCEDVMLQPDIVLYGDMIPKLNDAIKLVSSIDMLLIIGTSFYTSTATYISDAAKGYGAKVKVINERAEEQIPILLDDILN